MGGKPGDTDPDQIIDPQGQGGVDDQAGKQITLDDDKAGAAGDQSQQIDLDDAADNDKAFKSLDARAFAAMRKENTEWKKKHSELEKKIKELSEKPPVQAAAPTQPQYTAPHQQREFINGVPVPQTKVEWDALARQDWQLAVDMRSIINARRITAEARSVQDNARTLDEAKIKVLEKHPELNDATTDKGRIYLEVLDKHPEYLTLPRGPIYAMREMEEIMEERGLLSDKKEKDLAQKESQRVSRAALTAGGKFTPKSDKKIVTLTKEELEFCEQSGLKPETFAQKKYELEASKKGVQL